MPPTGHHQNTTEVAAVVEHVLDQTQRNPRPAPASAFLQAHEVQRILSGANIHQANGTQDTRQ